MFLEPEIFHQDHVFEELLERAKTTPTRRKEHIEREEQQYQLRVAQKRQRIIDKVGGTVVFANLEHVSGAGVYVLQFASLPRNPKKLYSLQFYQLRSI